MTASYQAQLSCPRCGYVVGEDSAYDGCPSCRMEDVAVNLQPDYTHGALRSPEDAQPGLFRYRALLPLRAGTSPVSLDEGTTPVLESPRLAAEAGVARLLIKDESRNPTWSYKDRLAAVAVTKARELGADTVVVSTTGNHGAAAAAYAAAAGLRCVVLTLESVPQTMKVLMQALGAEVVALREGPQRWALMAEAVAKRGWVPLSNYHDPPIGSNPFGVEGYKTIAYELTEQLEGAPDVVVVPAAYADGLAGIHRGFAELVAHGRLTAVPRMVAAEAFGPYAEALTRTGDAFRATETRSTVMFSIATPLPTYQGVRALRASMGTASGYSVGSRTG